MLCTPHAPMSVADAKARLRQVAAKEPSLLLSVLTSSRLHPKDGLLVAFAGGLLLGASPRLRRTLKQLAPLLLDQWLPKASSQDPPTCP